MQTDTEINIIKRQITERHVTLRIPGMDDATHNLLKLAFDQICGRVDWKGPINAVVPMALAGVYAEAIRFYTATEPVQSCDCEKGHVRLVSIGYQGGAAGDH